MTHETHNQETFMMAEAFHYMEIGRFQQAADRFKTMLSDSPADGQLLYLLAVCHYNLDELKEAENCCREALAQGYDEEECFFLSGKICMESGKYSEAEQYFLDALRANPQNPEIIASYGYLMYKTGYEKKAKQLLEEARRLEPDNETVLHYHFMVYLAEDNRFEQQRTLRQYIYSADNEVNKLVKIGLADYFKHDYRSAKENFRQAFLLDPTNKGILEILNKLEWKTNLFVRPVTWLEKIGGGAVVWIIFIAIAGGLMLFNMKKPAVIVALVYIIFCIYTWIIAAISKFSSRGRS